ncbi:cytochrome P450 [Pacificimonas flava]|uniref:Putative cytochrome P450 hydroxylase n=1 Tax=Pacificimonas flava TaxID=1234595 RepID=M2TQQ4_9SPHN|nr:cytochrome P450 [Pacificimonas flava]EMD84121.1 putative cytochrome P450 hydroxylase [Pacificimonas flava]MBB5280002.1 cytochrome P450 [Pacificimonas flava]
MASLPQEQTLAFDPTMSEVWLERRWPEMFAEMRATDPLHYTMDSGYGAFWNATKYKDIVEIEALPKVFSSSWQYSGITVADADPEIEAEDRMPMFIAMDPPEHTPQRRTVSPKFTPSEMTFMEPEIRERTGVVLDSLPVGEPFDWTDVVSIELTTGMLALLFDFPWEERRRLTRWSDYAGDINAARDKDFAQERMNVMYEMGMYFAGLWEYKKQQDPGRDLISMMQQSEAMAHMPEKMFIGNLILLIVGGNDTTRNSMTGVARTMHLWPEEWEKLRGEGEGSKVIKNAVQELIRWQTPLAHMRRTCLEDYEIRGKTIRKGDKVVMWYASANRDEEMFEDGDRFIADRENARRQLAFGYGIHRCVGARLAELQLTVLVEEMLKRGIQVSCASEPTRVESCFVNGYRKQMVTITRS